MLASAYIHKCVPIPYSSIKRNPPSVMWCRSAVSIPYSSIKSINVVLRNLPVAVSIPYSSIKSLMQRYFCMKYLKLFQFHIVRLKEVIAWNAICVTFVSIPYSSIKRFIRLVSRVAAKSVSIPYSSIKSPCERPLMPWHSVSIPYSSIKRCREWKGWR